MKKIKLLLAFSALVLCTLALSLTANAQGYHNVYPTPQSDSEKTLLTAEPLTLKDADGVVGISALYSVNKDALAALETEYNVTFGVLLARSSDGYNQNNLALTLDENGKIAAPARVALLTVYSTRGTHDVNGTFLTAEKNSFSATLNIETKTVDRSKDGAVHLAFILLESKDGGKAPRFLYVARKGTSFGVTPSVESAMQSAYNKNKEDPMEQEAYVAFLQEQVKSSVDEVAGLRVITAGDKKEAATLAPGERAIWVQYLPNKDPYANDTNSLKRNIRAAYIYYPLDFDPSTKSTSQLSELGVVRVFAYIGVTNNAQSAGLVCVHGGGGHAYAQYVNEALINGYAAIAIDTEGYHNTTGGTTTTYSSAEESYIRDTLGHVSKDGFANAEGSLTNQWLYYCVMDTALANTVLRSLPSVKEDSVGITGISWGGLITTTALCFDHRYAFASPIYISFHMSESYSESLSGVKTEGFATALWQDAELLSKCPVPTLIISSESDGYASVDTISKTANDMPNASILIKPDLDHGQQHGATLPEIYRFGYTILGERDGFVTPEVTPTAEMGRSYTLTLTVPTDGSDVWVTLYYRTEPFYKHTGHKKMTFYAEDFLVNDDGTVEITVPEDAYMYFISFSCFTQDAYEGRIGSLYYYDKDKFPQGYIYSSTDLIILGENED